MKRAAIIVLICVLALSSCGAARKTADDYLFAEAGGVLYKYNLSTFVCSPLCDDPLCSHDTPSCKYNEVGESLFAYEGNIIFFRGKECVSYDPKNASDHTLFTAKGEVFSPAVFEDHLFFNTLSYDFSPGAEHSARVDLFRYDFGKSDPIQLNDEELYDIQDIISCNKEKVIWNDTGLGRIYTTDTDYNSREESNEEYYGMFSGGKAYKMRVASVSPVSFDLISQKDEKPVIKGFAAVHCFDNAIVAVYNSDFPEIVGRAPDGMGGYDEVKYNLSNDIYVFDPDGGNKRLLCTIPEGLYISSIANVPTLISGDVFGIQLIDYSVNASGIIESSAVSPTVAIVDLSTGELRITEGK
ncbi:MAG: hypothetical protein IJT91_01975 [Clostridia bacterium]|nr:hypothetical protein [Clostridia bacterium]